MIHKDGKGSRFASGSLPAELIERRQWVGCRIVPQGKAKPKKIPVIATDPHKNASSTNPATWSTFAEARAGLAQGHYQAVGYVLAGDIVGIDLDGERWVVGDGKLAEETKDIVDRSRSYAEWSISGKGVHILLHGTLPWSGHRNDKVGVEVYTSKRFFIMTGQHIEGTPATINQNQAAIDWILQRYFGEASEKAERTEDMTSEVSEHSEYSDISVISEASEIPVEQIITDTLPKKMGQRNACVFQLARGLKYNSGPRYANGAEWKPVVRRWHQKALAVVGTKPFDDTWADFLRAYQSARLPLGTALDGWALQRAKQSLPPAADGYDTVQVKLLVGMCWHLAKMSPQQRFFLSSHRAGVLLEISQSTALGYLQMLRVDGVIEVAERGNERRATRYRYCGGEVAEQKDLTSNSE